MNRFKIFLDMDGVVCNWQKKACQLMDVNLKNNKIRRKLKRDSKIQNLNLFDIEELEETLNTHKPNFWANLEKFSWSDDLYYKLKKNNTVFFLTSPGKRKTKSFNGKREWLKKQYNTDKIIFTTEKYACATKESVLIDDSEKNINKFVEWGGNAILFPNQFLLEDKEEFNLFCYYHNGKFIKFKSDNINNLIKYIYEFTKDIERKLKYL